MELSDIDFQKIKSLITVMTHQGMSYKRIMLILEAEYPNIFEGIAVFNGNEQIAGKKVDKVIVDEFGWNTPKFVTPETVYCSYRDLVPKPVKQKLNIKQANRQSFRQSMRSVNRNK